MNSLSSILSKAILFLKKQHRDWKVTVLRTSIDRLSYQMVYPYLSIYIMALGASATQLGMVNSLGMVIAGLFSPLTGWFIDRTGPKKIYLFGIGMLGISYLTYGISGNWTMTILAMVTYWLGFAVSVHSCATICGNCLTNEDRATGMSFCETFAAGILGMAGPIIGAWSVASFGGINADGIRPLFFFALIGTAITFFVVLTQLSGKKWTTRSETSPHFVRDLHQVLKEGKHLKRWLVIASIGTLPMGMILPFSQVFAHEVKLADAYVLGAMVTGAALASIVFAMPLGNLADRLGRKKVLYITIPLFWVSNLMLVLAPSQYFLIAAGVLQGFYNINVSLTQAMERELVPAEQMGRWLGISRFFRMILNAIMALVSGIVWDKLGPQYVFLIFVGLELFIRMPLLITMPETLTLKLG